MIRGSRPSTLLFSLLVLSAALLLIHATASRATTLFFDDFNTEHNGTGVLNYTSFTNWTVTRGYVDLIGNSYFDFNPGNGLYLDMAGSGGEAGRIETTSTFALIPCDYELVFDVSGSRRHGTFTMDYGIGNFDLGSVTLTYIEPQGGGFMTLGIPFTLNTPLVGSIYFDQAVGGNIGLLLDNVCLNRMDANPVPEPTSMLLLASGLGGVAALQRKKRRDTV